MSTNTELQLAEVTARFRPTDRFPYRAAYSPSEFRMYAIFDGVNYQFGVKRHAGGKEEMDQNAHALRRNFGPDAVTTTSQSTDIGEAKKRLNAALDTAFAPVKEENPLGGYLRAVLDREVLEVGFEGIWADGMVDRWRANENNLKADPLAYKPIDIYQWAATSASPVFCNPVELSFLKKLAAARRFAEAVEVMKTFVDGVGVGLFKVIDRRLTKRLNRFLSVELSIPGLDIDSFFDDAEKVAPYLAKKFYDGGTGTLIDVLNANQQTIITDAISITDEETTRNLFTTLYGDYVVYDSEAASGEADALSAAANEQHIPMVFLVEPSSFTLLNFDFQEIDIAFEANSGAILNESACPAFYRLAKLIFEEFGKKARHHYVKTLDGRIFEISRGYLGDDCYIISLKR